ncbi:MAG TPA: DUF3563 family protein [Casimicrobiaceae bacterium]|nr:DUF3563 family protein [Casimicrobiaceae bacterium]
MRNELFPQTAPVAFFNMVVDVLSRPTLDGAPEEAPGPKAGWLDRLDDWLWRQQAREREAWLAQSSDVFELERRIEELDRGTPSLF